MEQDVEKGCFLSEPWPIFGLLFRFKYFCCYDIGRIIKDLAGLETLRCPLIN
jgi:hypothetical protein